LFLLALERGTYLTIGMMQTTQLKCMAQEVMVVHRVLHRFLAAAAAVVVIQKELIYL
jgi:hypothetical protein